MTLSSDHEEDSQNGYALSPIERDIWTLENLLDEPVYNVHSSVIVHGAIDEDVLRVAAESLVTDQAVLRSRFRIGPNAELRRMVVTDASVTITDRESSAPLVEVLDTISADIMHPFDLANEPLFRIFTHRVRGNAVVITLVLHHLVCDRDALATAWRSLARRYNSALAGHEPSLAPPPTPPERGRRRLALDRQEEYWRRQLRGATVAELVDQDRRPEAAATRTSGRKMTLNQSPEAACAVAELQARGAGTPSMVHICAAALAGAVYTGQRDVIIGMPSSRLPASHDGETFGVRVNLLPIRVHVRPQDTLRTILHQVRGTVADALDHGDVSAVSILREVAPPKRQFDPVIYTAVGVYEQVVSSIYFGNQRADEVEIDGRQSLYPINLQYTTSQSEGSRIVTFQTELYDGPTVMRLIRDIDAITSLMASHPEMLVSELIIWASRRLPSG